jgi:hypothetical protein
MPQAIPIIAAIIAAAGVGTSIYEGVKSSDQNAANQAAQQAELKQQQQAQANQANLTKQEAVLGAQGQSQTQTGGSLTDSGTAALTDLLAGYPGYQSGTSGGNTSLPLSTGGTGGAATPDIASILSALTNGSTSGNGLNGGNLSGSISGGNWQAPSTQAQPWQELSKPVLG